MRTRSDEGNSADLVARSASPLRCRRRAALLALVLEAGACAAVTYPGPRRSSSQVAIVGTQDVAIEEIDGRDVRGRGPRFEVLPGNHLMVVRLLMSARDPGFVGPSVPTPFCVFARPQHDYLVEPTNAGSLWRPVILDESAGIRVPPCGPIASDHRDDFPCGGALGEVSLASGVQKLTGCGMEKVYGYDPSSGQWKSVTEQAMFDLNCPGHALTVHHLGGAAVSVVGCGLRADYVADMPCVAGLCAFARWVPNVPNTVSRH
jgi:hypothetical protein